MKRSIRSWHSLLSTPLHLLGLGFALTLGLALGLGCASAPDAAPPATAVSTRPVVAPPVPPVPPASVEVADRLDPATAPLTASLPIDPAVRTGKLDNGFTYFLRHNTRPRERAQMWLVVNAGSVLEDDDQQGLAHFVEHMAFNGTRRFAKQELVEYLESIGMRFGPDLNAYTSFDETVYVLQVPTDSDEILERAFDILEDWAGGLTFEEEEIDKERGVVMEEWRLSRGAGARLFDRQYPVLLAGSKYAERLPIGQTEVLQTAPYEALRRFYRDWYRPELMALVAVGDFDVDRFESLARDHFSSLSNPAQPRPRVQVPVPLDGERRISIESDPEATRTSLAIYHKQPRSGDATVGSYRQEMVEVLYSWIVNARLGEVAQQADPPFIGAGQGSSDFGRSIKFETSSTSVEQGGVLRGLEALLTEGQRVSRHGLTESELARAKKDLLRSFEQAAQEQDKMDSRGFAGEYVQYFLTGEPTPGVAFEVGLARRFVPQITLQEVEAVHAKLAEGSEVILLSGPSEQIAALPAEEELLAVFDTVADKPVEPYVDRVLDQPLLAEMPRAGEIVAESTLEELKLTEWTLSNGVRVMLRPTDFQNDQVILAGYSPGGHSLAADADHASALFATTVLGEGGLGDFDQIELGKALAGKVAMVRPYIEELEEGITGFASPEDLETLFQLLYLTFTQPRRDPSAFQSFIQRASAMIANRSANPDVVFGDKFAEVVSQGHRRRRPLSPELLAEVDLDRGLAVYRDRFADAGDFTFILVGNLDLEKIRPLVETYLGGLPTTGREESWRDVGVDTPAEVIEFEVREGLEPKSRVSLLYSGEAEFSRDQLHALTTFARVLNNRLREVLREDLGGTYGVSVSATLSQKPRQRYSLSISFGCAPEKAEMLKQRVFTEIAQVRDHGLDPKYLQKVEEAQVRSRETSLRQNGFWLGLLKNYDSSGFDKRLILQFQPLVDGFTDEDVQTAARRYLNPERYVLGVLYPENGPGEAAAQ